MNRLFVSFLLSCCIIPGSASSQSFEFHCAVPYLPITHAGPNFLWSVGSHHFAYKLDLSTCAKVDSVQFQIPTANNGRDIGWDGSNLWYSEWSLDSLYKINPNTGAALARFRAPGPRPQGIAYGGGYVWHTDENTEFIYKINPLNGSVDTTLPVPETAGYFAGLEYWNGTLWLANYTTRNIYQIDASTGAVLRSYQFPSGNLTAITTNGVHLYISVNNTTPQGVYRLYVTSIEESKFTWPERIQLGQNYPNPFNPSTTIAYDLPSQSHVSLKVYDLLGREVATLVNGFEQPGRKNVNFNASNLSSGVYFYRLQAGDFVSTKKLVILK